MDINLIARWVFGISTFIILICGSIQFYYVFYYLWKFEKKHDGAIKKAGIFFIERLVCTSILARLAIRKPNKPLPWGFSNNSYALMYTKLPYEDIKPFKILFWVLIIEGIFFGIAFLVLMIFLG